MKESVLEKIKEEFSEALEKALKSSYPKNDIGRDAIRLSVSIPKGSNGDLSSSVSFRIANIEKKSPKDVADNVLKALKAPKTFVRVEVFNGYINAWLDEKTYSEDVIKQVTKEGSVYGGRDIGKGLKVILESPSINPNKPWHIGHLRNAMLGDSLSNILQFCSYKVERENYIDDLGLQVANSIWGYINLGNKPDKKFDLWLGEQYVEVNKRLKDKEVMEQVKEIVERMEHDTKEAKIGKELVTRCLKAQYETAFSYKIYHNLLVWESDIVKAKLLDEALRLAQDKGVVEKQKDGKYKGCLVISLSDLKGMESLGELEEDTKVLVRSNGTPTYVAKDIANHLWKFGIITAKFGYEEFMKQPNGNVLYTTSQSGKSAKFGEGDVVINIIGSAQKHPQLILKSALAAMGYEKQAQALVHISYGEVELAGGSLSGRKGGWIGEEKNYTADDLLKEMKGKAAEKVKVEKGKEEIADAVSLAAIKFEFLRVSPEKKITFSWEKALNFDTNSGPYCMYMYARANKILEKSEMGSIDFAKMTRGNDFELLKIISQAPEIVKKAANEKKPSAIAEYLIELCAAFSKFYETMPVLKSESKELRLAITLAAKQTMGNMLKLLGIEPLGAI